MQRKDVPRFLLGLSYQIQKGVSMNQFGCFFLPSFCFLANGWIQQFFVFSQSDCNNFIPMIRHHSYIEMDKSHVLDSVIKLYGIKVLLVSCLRHTYIRLSWENIMPPYMHKGDTMGLVHSLCLASRQVLWYSS